ncbi:response regulator [Actinophytocola sp.]|uniref:response regulator n=1 Tax=Actinophytocola sp. TaxID=1872138 RepID=UPI002D440476|nr:response regulator [Actinophytocola sp.]HYQ68158.1 response regulator [Actinophytocola sp.]
MNDSRRLFQEMADFASVGIAVIDPAGSAKYANRRLAEITHRSQEGLLGMDLKSVLIPEVRVSTRNPDKNKREGRYFRCHTDVEAGSRRTVEVVLRWLAGDDNRPTGAVAIIDYSTDDSTDEDRERAGGRRHAAGARQHVTERLARLVHMAAGIAHEFDDTLANMLANHGGVGQGRAVPRGMTGRVSRPPPVDHEDHDDHEDLPASTRFDVNDLIRATVPAFVEQEPALTLSLRLAEPPTTVHMDPSQLAEALRLLTVNAVEAVPSDGAITIVASRARNHPTAPPDGEFVHIAVVDNGRGMAADSLEHAIEPFFTTKVGTPWGGLGLATTYGIVNHAGGRMSIASTPGAGTTVHVYVPSAGHVRHNPPPGDTGQSRGTLLIVDDDQELRTIATRFLTTAGFEVLTATCGVDALALLRNRTFDCLVTDIAMPDMGGIDLAESANALDSEMPVVYVSGFVDMPWGAGGLLPDDAHSLTKPYTAETLTATVRRAVRSRTSRAT